MRGRNSDNTLLREVLGWEPAIDLEDGLERTYRWIERAGPRDASRRQVAPFPAERPCRPETMLVATRSTPVLGVDFFAGSYDDAVHSVIDRGLAGAGGYATLTSVHGLVLAQHDAVLRRALDEATTNFPDGVPVTWLQHSTGAPGAQRVCGIDLMPSVLAAGQPLGVRHYFLGSTPDVLAGLAERTAERYPRAHVVGSFSPRSPP